MSVERKAALPVPPKAAALPKPADCVMLTDDYRKNSLAKCVPGAWYGAGAWYLPPEPDADQARIALRIFPALQVQHPELVATARLSAIDYRPIDLSTPHWEANYAGRAPENDPWQRCRLAALEYRTKKGELKPITPHPFQRMDAQYAIDRLSAGIGVYYGWEMGLGKTLGAALTIDGWDANFVFIACPNSAKVDPWVDDFSQFCPWITPVVMGNSPKTRAYAMDKAQELSDADEPFAMICHYEAIALIDGPKKTGWSKLGRWDLKVCDEAHTLKSRMAKRTAAFRRLKSVGTLLLSGSVMSGAAEDLFVPFQIMRPKKYRSQHRDWNDPYIEIVDGDYGQIVIGPKLHKLPEFKAAMGESLIVRLASDHLNIPAPHVKEHRVKLLPSQSKAYHALADDLLAELPDGSVIATTDGAPMVTALRRVTACVPNAEGGYDSAKLDKAMELIEAAGDSQIVVFTWHKEPGYALADRLADAGIGHGLVNGDYNAAQRVNTIDLFKRGGTRVLIATMATLSVAANLQNASQVIVVEESFDPIDNEQAVGRVVRQGQLIHASVHYIRGEDTVDDLHVLPATMSKSELRRLVIGTKSC